MNKIILVLILIGLNGCREQSMESKCSDARSNLDAAKTAQKRYYRDNNEEGFRKAGEEIDRQLSTLSDCSLYGY